MNIIKKINSLSQNDIIIYKNIIGAFLIKGLALLVSLLTMPAYMRFFSEKEVLGVWFTILSILTWILNFDIGIGNGLRNKLSKYFALNDYNKAKEYISSSYAIIGFVVMLLSVIGILILPIVDWNSVFNIPTELISQNVLLEVVRFVFIGIMLQFFLRLISSILYAMQKSAINNFIALLISVLQLVFVIICPMNTNPEVSLKRFSIAYIFCVNIPLLLTTIIIFCGPLKKCIPNIFMFSISKAKDILSLGGLFFACQILYMIIANTNEFFISKYTTPGYVVEYQIYNRLFTIGSMVFMLMLTPIWSAVSKAIAENNFIWLNKIFKNLRKLSLLGIVGEVLLIPFLQVIVNIWLGENSIKINYKYALCFALFGSIMIIQTTLSTFVNGAGRMKLQAISYLCAVIGKVMIIYIGILIVESWIVIVFANFLVILPYCIVQYIDLNRYIESNLKLSETIGGEGLLEATSEENFSMN